MEDLGEKWAKQIVSQFRPMAVFLYGSRARKDYQETSDWELGVVFSKKDYVSSVTLRKFVTDKTVLAFPFVYEDFINLNANTPFQKKCFYYDLVLGGRMLFGKNVLKQLNLAQIGRNDLAEVLYFNLGYSLAAVHEFRRGDKELSENHLFKAIMYGTKCLLMGELGEFAVGYEEIFELSKKIDLGEYCALLGKAEKWRRNNQSFDESDYYRCLTYLSGFIQPKIVG